MVPVYHTLCPFPPGHASKIKLTPWREMAPGQPLAPIKSNTLQVRVSPVYHQRSRLQATDSAGSLVQGPWCRVMAARFLQDSSEDEAAMCMLEAESTTPDTGAPPAPQRVLQAVVYKPRVGYRAWQTPGIADEGSQVKGPGPVAPPGLAKPAKPAKDMDAKAAALTLAASAAAVKAGQAAANAAAALAHRRPSPPPAATPPRTQTPAVPKGEPLTAVTPPSKHARASGDAEPFSTEKLEGTHLKRRVEAKSPDTAVQGAGSAKATAVQGAGSAKAKAKPVQDSPSNRKGKRQRAPRGSAGTFAGHRPPKSPARLEAFEALKAEYLKAQEVARALRKTDDKKSSKKRRLSDNQLAYFAFMKAKMSELAAGGVPGPDRMKQAAMAWQEKVSQSDADDDEPLGGN